MIGGRHDSFDITVADIKNMSSESRKDTEFSPEQDLCLSQMKKCPLLELQSKLPSKIW